MDQPNASTGQGLAALAVWTHLTAERRAHVLRLLTQLAYTFITTPLENSSEDTNHATRSQPRQDPPRTP